MLLFTHTHHMLPVHMRMLVECLSLSLRTANRPSLARRQRLPQCANTHPLHCTPLVLCHTVCPCSMPSAAWKEQLPSFRSIRLPLRQLSVSSVLVVSQKTSMPLSGASPSTRISLALVCSLISPLLVSIAVCSFHSCGRHHTAFTPLSPLQLRI